MLLSSPCGGNQLSYECEALRDITYGRYFLKFREKRTPYLSFKVLTRIVTRRIWFGSHRFQSGHSPRVEWELHNTGQVVRHLLHKLSLIPVTGAECMVSVPGVSSDEECAVQSSFSSPYVIYIIHTTHLQI